MKATVELLSRGILAWIEKRPFSKEAKERRQAKRKARRAEKRGELTSELIEVETPQGGDMDALKGALKSKLVWLGVLQIGYSLVEAYIAGTLTVESVSTAISGVLTIVFRAVTDKPLSAK